MNNNKQLTKKQQLDKDNSDFNILSLEINVVFGLCFYVT